MGPTPRFRLSPRLRTALAYPVPFAAILLSVVLLREGEPAWWSALGVGARAAATFIGIVLGLILLQVLSDAWYRLADPQGLGAKTHTRADLCDVLSFGGLMGMTVAWMAHARELPVYGIWLMLMAGPLWSLVFGLLARRMATGGRMANTPGAGPSPHP
ncbi:MAG: hypothetical protein ACKVP7_06070 [Hyphomicrobiaceae bacterium]